MSPLRSLPGLRAWRSLTQLQRVMVYFRWSMYVVVSMMLPLVIWVVIRANQSPIPAVVVGIQTAAVLVMCSQFLREVPPQKKAYRPALGVLIAGFPVMVAFAETATPDELGRLYWMSQWWLGGAGLAMIWPVSVVVVVTVIGWLITRDVIVVMLLLTDFTTRSTRWVVGTLVGLDEARRTSAALSVAEERLRFSRDVHDVVGRSLSTIAVKSELAARLSEKGDPRAGEQMRQVRQLAHDALAEARELARGYRTVNCAAEIDGARSLVEHAGINCVVTGPGVDDRWSEPAAWVVREAVTNVIRHSAARRVDIHADRNHVTVVNDGVGDGDSRTANRTLAGGSGLSELRARLVEVGGSLQVIEAEDKFTVSATFGEAAERNEESR